MRWGSILLLTTALSMPALAAEPVAPAAVPGACGVQHGRLAVVAYKPATLVECVTSPDVATTIVLAPDETVGPVVASDAQQVTVKGSHNFAVIWTTKEEVGRSPSFTFETAAPDGKKRPYFFLFHVEASGGMAGIQMTYPDDQAAANKAAVVVKQQEAHREVIASRLKTAMFDGGQNWSYVCRCANGSDIVPNEFFDNGQTTKLRYAGSRLADIVVFRVDRDQPMRVRPTPVGDLLVIPEVAAKWLIVSGTGKKGEAIEIDNRAYHPELHPNGLPPGVIETIKPTPLPPRRQSIEARAASAVPAP